MFLKKDSLLLFLMKYSVLGFLFGVISAPYNHELSPQLFPVPFLSLPLLFPFIHLVINEKKHRKFWGLWLWGTFVTFAKTMWLINVTIEGKWIYVLLALFLLSLFLGVWYTVTGYVLTFLHKKKSGIWPFTAAAAWVVIDWLKSTGELSFPWYLQGYLFTSVLPFSQIAAVTGIWGMTWIVILCSCLLYRRLVEKQPMIRSEAALLILFSLVILWGTYRVRTQPSDTLFTVGLVQSNLDHKNWDRKSSLDRAMAINDSLMGAVKDLGVDLFVLPESGVYTYLDHNWRRTREVQSWVEKYKAPIMMGTLDYTKRDDGSGKRNVYNTAFLQRPFSKQFEKYYKMKLVPVSEGMPYGWKFPILSRIEIPGGSFSRGFEETVWEIDSSFSIAPTICYEAIYPGFNRSRVKNSVDAVVNITNDSWFGVSRGPHQHAEMARLRAIETGVPVVRCAASGVSMVVDPVGRVLAKTTLGTRDILVSGVPEKRKPTLYVLLGDWFVYVMAIFLAVTIVLSYRKKNV